MSVLNSTELGIHLTHSIITLDVLLYFPGTIASDAVVLTSGGTLSCQHIAHMAGPNTAADITSSIEKVLDLCEGKTASSLSVPAIGTGDMSSVLKP